jgi:deoxycytidylate deaminase
MNNYIITSEELERANGIIEACNNEYSKNIPCISCSLLILCCDCKHIVYDQWYKDYYCEKRGMLNRVKVRIDFFCADGEAK